MMKRVGLLALVCLATFACDQKPVTPEASSARPAVLVEPVIEQVAPDAAGGYAVRIQSGEWCRGDASRVFLAGNSKFCSSARNLHLDPDLGAPYRRIEVVMDYHQPGPKLANGSIVGRSESDMRFNCDTGEATVIVAITYDVDGKELLRQTKSRDGRNSSQASPDMKRAVCDRPL